MRTSWSELAARAGARDAVVSVPCRVCRHPNLPGERHCAYCDADLGKTKKPPSAATWAWQSPTEPPTFKAPVGSPASSGQRLGAALIDAVVSFVIMVMLIFTVAAATGTIDTEAANTGAVSTGADSIEWSVLLLGLTIWWFGAYVVYAALSTLFGRTLGKLACGITVVRRDGARLTSGVRFLRSFAYPFAALPFGLGLLWITISPSGRGWHDYLCDTRVVTTR